MNRLLLTICLAALALGAVTLAQQPVRVAVVAPQGGFNDQSFGQAAQDGVNRARAVFGDLVEFILREPADDPQAQQFYDDLAEQGVRVIIGVSFSYLPFAQALAPDFPDTYFAIVDDFFPAEQVTQFGNVIGLRFREEQGSFLVGIIAGALTQTGTVGFVGGLQGDLIEAFGAGYQQGIKFADERLGRNTQLLINFAGLDIFDAFLNPAKGLEIARGQQAQGADIIYHAAGQTGNGVIQAATDPGYLERDGQRITTFAIGVDSDQGIFGIQDANNDGVPDDGVPTHVITSMLKRTDTAVFETIRQAVDGELQAGNVFFTLADGGLDYVLNDLNGSLIPRSVMQLAEEARQLIVNGQLQVGNKFE
ncbi:MAG: BMP family ABC transporter substrate-binding protein [Deinococcus sp.]|nr:BMP family ABC transporter substrate-binding protein [Deinococcus sp.]